jgi:hypothetical protein
VRKHKSNANRPGVLVPITKQHLLEARLVDGYCVDTVPYHKTSSVHNLAKTVLKQTLHSWLILPFILQGSSGEADNAFLSRNGNTWIIAMLLLIHNVIHLFVWFNVRQPNNGYIDVTSGGENTGSGIIHRMNYCIPTFNLQFFRLYLKSCMCSSILLCALNARINTVYGRCFQPLYERNLASDTVFVMGSFLILLKSSPS